MMTMVLNLPSSVRGGDELIHLPASHLAPTLTDEPSLWRRKSDNMPPPPSATNIDAIIDCNGAEVNLCDRHNVLHTCGTLDPCYPSAIKVKT